MAQNVETFVDPPVQDWYYIADLHTLVVSTTVTIRQLIRLTAPAPPAVSVIDISSQSFEPSEYVPLSDHGLVDPMEDYLMPVDPVPLEPIYVEPLAVVPPDPVELHAPGPEPQLGPASVGSNQIGGASFHSQYTSSPETDPSEFTSTGHSVAHCYHRHTRVRHTPYVIRGRGYRGREGFRGRGRARGGPSH